MAITRNFKETVQARALHDDAFRQGLLTESIGCMLSGNTNTGKSLLRDYINAKVGFEKLAAMTDKPSKSLMRMFSLVEFLAPSYHRHSTNETLISWICG